MSKESLDKAPLDTQREKPFSPEDAERELKDIEKLKDELLATTDPVRAKELKAELELRMDALRERIFPMERELHLREQYASQLRILENAHVLLTLPSGEKGVIGIDGRAYPVPSYKEFTSLIRENRDVINHKKDQGFKRMILVPFGMKLDLLISKYGDLLVKHHKEGKLFAPKEKEEDPDLPLDFDESEPVLVWDAYKDADVKGTLVYDPTSSTKENHGGRTKSDILAAGGVPRSGSRPSSGTSAGTAGQAPGPGWLAGRSLGGGWLAGRSLGGGWLAGRSLGGGWRILFVEDDPVIPRETNDPLEKQKLTIGGRERLLANKAPNDYLKKIGKGQYEDESGLSPEDWLALAIAELTEKNCVLDDWQGRGSIAYNTGAFFPVSGNVPYAGWNRGGRRASLGGIDPGSRNPDIGARGAVRVGG